MQAACKCDKLYLLYVFLLKYSYDPVIGKHFAQARFYDSGQGRMLSPDPIKRRINPYPYCDNDPVNYNDPTGEIPSILLGAGLGGLIGGASGFIGSAASQLTGGGKFNWKKAAGAAANGAVVGAAKGALIGSGAGIPIAFATDFAAGSVGNALEQKITKGRVDLGESLISGAGNALSEVLYGTGPIRGVKDAFLRGARTGAVMSGLDNIADTVGPFGVAGSRLLGKKPKDAVSGGTGRDPRGKCGSPDPFDLAETLGDRKRSQDGAGHSGGFSLGGFLKDVAIGGIVGGLGSAAFYGAGRAVNALGEHLAGSGSGRSKVIYGTDDITKYQYNMIENPGPLAEMNGGPAKNFYGGRYNMEILQEDRIMYRAGDSQKAYGRWFTSEPPTSIAKVRIDTAVRPFWIDSKTGVKTGGSHIDCVYAIKIPKGTTIYTGPVGPQGGVHVGGYDIMQTFIEASEEFEIVKKMILK